MSEPFQSENLHPLVLENSFLSFQIIFLHLLSVISLCSSYHLSTFFEVFYFTFLVLYLLTEDSVVVGTFLPLWVPLFKPLSV